MIQWLHCLLGYHAETLRERRDDGGINLRCPACGHVEPMIYRIVGDPNRPRTAR